MMEQAASSRRVPQAGFGYFRRFALIAILAFAALIVSGCLGFSVRVRTVVDQRDVCIRQLDYEGAEWEHFLLPSGNKWQLTRTDSGTTAKAQFDHPKEIGQDLVFDASHMVTDRQWQDFAQTTGSSGTKPEGLRLTNKVSYHRKNFFILHQYKYVEELDRHLIGKYLKYEYFDRFVLAGHDSAVVSRQALNDLYTNGTAFQLTCAVRLPGNIISTNADLVEEQVAIWEISLADFEKDQPTKRLEITTQRFFLYRLLSVIAVVAALDIWVAVLLVRRKRTRQESPFARLKS